jgi:catechol 2,3-dioxygenase-like lactoylglutathione lyase family enzyme
MSAKRFQGLRTCLYKVSDIEKAKSWYTKAFGASPYFEEPFYVGYNIGGYELGLQPDPGTKGDSVVAYWGVDDVESAFKHLLEVGATEKEKPQDVGENVIVASVIDPWDNVIGIIYNPGFSLEEPPVH